MPQVQGNDSDVNTALEHVHCDRMTDEVWKDPPLRKLGKSVRGTCNSAPQSVGEAHPRERATRSVGKQRFVISPGVRSQPTLQILGGVAPQGHGTFFPTLSADSNPCGGRKCQIARTHAEQLRDAGAGVVQHRKHHPIALSDPRATVWSDQNRLDVFSGEKAYHGLLKALHFDRQY
jgi:hypothetical protein